MATKRKAQDAKIEDALAKKMGNNNPATPPDTKSASSGAKQAAQDVPEGEADNQPAAAPEAAEATKAAAAEAKPAKAAKGTKQDAKGAPDEEADKQAAADDQAAEGAVEAVEIKPAPGHALVTYTGYINLRTAPSTTARIAGRIGRGNRLEVLGTAEGDGHTWYALPGGLFIMADAGLLNFCPR